MKASEIIIHRLRNQQLISPKFLKPHEIVAWFGAMQAQEYAMAKWAIGLRLLASHDHEIEQAFNDGKILRIHCVRPTWHFVTPEDIRMVLAVTAPRIQALSAYMNRKLSLNSNIFKRSNDLLVKILEGGNSLTRETIRTEFSRIKIPTTEQRLSHLMMQAELDGIVCSGPRQGKHQTYALLSERAPSSKKIDRREALVELSQRYFSSRGPATINDFAYWSGITAAEAKTGALSLSKQFEKIIIDGKEYFFLPNRSKPMDTIRTAFLMPDYDELGMGYKDRSAIQSDTKIVVNIRGGNPIFNRMLVVNGRIAGTWKRTVSKNDVEVKIFPFKKLTTEEKKRVARAVEQFKQFTIPSTTRKTS